MTIEEKMNLDYFKPQLVIRYLQKQINEICIIIKKDSMLNESFREEFSGVHALKYFTQEALD